MGLAESNPQKIQIAILGGGPAGLSAAITAGELGVQCVLFERYDSLGGQYAAVHASRARRNLSDHDLQEIQKLQKRLAALNIPVVASAHLWQVAPDRSMIYSDDKVQTRYEFEKMIVATGAYERSLPFKGWTLPGVMTSGAAQRMLEQDGVAPGRRVLVAGRGPLMLQCAAQLVEAGVKVVAVVEATSFSHLLGNGLKRMGDFGSKLGQAFDYQWRLVSAGVPLLYGQAVSEAAGQEAVEKAITVELDSTGHPRPNKLRSWDVDAIVVSNGLEPDNRICRLLGCQLEYDALNQCYFPAHNERMQTSLDWLYVAGESAGLGGISKALVEGQVAGLQAAVSLGFVGQASVAARFAGLFEQHRKALRQALAVDSAYVQAGTMYDLAQPDTIICRCEEVTREKLREAISLADGSLRNIKNQARLTMGLCQGRLCESFMLHEAAMMRGKPADPQDLLRVRPPLEPIPLRTLAEQE